MSTKHDAGGGSEKNGRGPEEKQKSQLGAAGESREMLGVRVPEKALQMDRVKSGREAPWGPCRDSAPTALETQV